MYPRLPCTHICTLSSTSTSCSVTLSTNPHSLCRQCNSLTRDTGNSADYIFLIFSVAHHGVIDISILPQHFNQYLMDPQFFAPTVILSSYNNTAAHNGGLLAIGNLICGVYLLTTRAKTEHFRRLQASFFFLLKVKH